MKINVAIDGPSGAGKSTVAKELCKRFGFVHLDTGSMYRAVAYTGLKKGLKMDEEDKIEEMIQNMDLKILSDGTVLVNGENITPYLRTDEISMGASDVSKLLKVRKALVQMQQKIAEGGGYIMDGRDICSVVLPDAEVKVFLTASSEERAQRRFLENVQRGMEADYPTILEDIKKRDYQDSHRANSPLMKTDDAVEIDSTNMTMDEVIDAVSDLVTKASL